MSEREYPFGNGSVRLVSADWVQQNRGEPSGIAVIDAAMLPLWDEILEKLDYLVMVHSPKWQRANRLIQDRGMPQEQCEQRMDAQESLFERITPQIDYIIKNNGDLMEIRGKAVKVWLDIKG